MHGIGRREEIRVPGMPEPISHFTNVVRAGRLVFVSGCVASDAEGRTIGGNDATAQARQVHENLKKCLAAAGATFADVCKVTVFLKNIADREKVNVARKEYFGPHRPASTLVGGRLGWARVASSLARTSGILGARRARCGA